MEGLLRMFRDDGLPILSFELKAGRGIWKMG
jgi:hypothetical protein